MTAALVCGLFLTAQDNTDVLLDEVTAGCDATVTRILSGVASYRVTEQVYSKAPPGQKKQPGYKNHSYTASVQFRGESCYWEFAGRRCLRHGQLQTEYSVLDPQLQAVHHVAITDSIANATFSPFDFHPKAVGHSLATVQGEFYTVADLVRRNRRNPKAVMAAERDGAAIKVTVTWQEARYKMSVWVEPASGYGVTRQLDWALANPATPAIERKTTYKLAGDVMVAERHSYVERREQDGGYIDTRRGEMVLTDIDFQREPEDRQFTIDGLGLPAGARIIDKVSGEMSLYRVKAATQEEIEAAVTDILERGESSAYLTPLWRRAGRYLLWAGVGLISIAGLRLALRYWHRSW